MKIAASFVILLLVCFGGMDTYAKDKPKNVVKTKRDTFSLQPKPTKIKIAKKGRDLSPINLSLPGHIIEGVTRKLQNKLEQDFQNELEKKYK